MINKNYFFGLCGAFLFCSPVFAADYLCKTMCMTYDSAGTPSIVEDSSFDYSDVISTTPWHAYSYAACGDVQYIAAASPTNSVIDGANTPLTNTLEMRSADANGMVHPYALKTFRAGLPTMQVTFDGDSFTAFLRCDAAGGQ